MAGYAVRVLGIVLTVMLLIIGGLILFLALLAPLTGMSPNPQTSLAV